MKIAISNVSLDVTQGGVGPIPVFDLVDMGDGTCIAKQGDLTRQVDGEGHVSMQSVARPGAWEKFWLEGSIATYWPDQPSMTTSAYRYGATKVGG